MNLSLILAAWCMAAQPAAKAPIAANPTVELRGKVARVQLARGEGMPYLEVKHGSETTKVFLGARHYLMQQNFNPKVDAEVTVKGYKLDNDVYAATVTADGRELRLRDDKGFPVWCGACGGGPAGPGGGRGAGRGRMGNR